MPDDRANPTCPKCRSRDITLLEEWSTMLPFHACRDGSLRRVWSIPEHEPTGRIEGACRICGHEWRLRGVRQVSEFDAWRTAEDDGADSLCVCEGDRSRPLAEIERIREEEPEPS
jgi:hypothetical protein